MRHVRESNRRSNGYEADAIRARQRRTDESDEKNELFTSRDRQTESFRELQLLKAFLINQAALTQE